MKTLKVLLQEVVSGIKAWVNSNFAQESNTVHKTGNETVNGVKTFTGNVFQNQAGGVNVYCATCDGAVKGDLTSSGTLSIVCKDGSNANMETSGLAAVYMGQDTSGSYVALRADTSYNNTRYNASVSLDIDPTTANNNAIFRPRRDNTIDLGSSSYQFKNLYANNYYYKGTAWGLDKANVWSNNNTFSKICNIYNSDSTASTPVLKLQNSKAEVLSTGNTPSSQSLTFCEKNDYRFGRVMGMIQSNGVGVKIASFTQDANDDTVMNELQIMSFVDGSKCIFPTDNGQVHLGIYNYKWKTLNGINPGALSLPHSAISSNYNIATLITPPSGESTINIQGGDNLFTPTVDGWISIKLKNATYARVIRDSDENLGNVTELSNSVLLNLLTPVNAGLTYRITIYATSLADSEFLLIPCQGNV